MRRGELNKKVFLILISIILAGVMVLSACTLPPAPTPTPTSAAEKAEKVVTATVITTSDRAILAVYEHLLSQAQSAKAKVYLAEFYTACDNWSAKSELFKDGSSVCYVLVDMTSNKIWEWKPYWQQASWFVFRDGKVIPCNRIQANALRIEAELQELSVPPKA